MFHHYDINGFDLYSYFYRGGYVTQDFLNHCEVDTFCSAVMVFIKMSCLLKAVNHNNILKPSDSSNYLELHRGTNGTWVEYTVWSNFASINVLILSYVIEMFIDPQNLKCSVFFKKEEIFYSKYGSWNL